MKVKWKDFGADIRAVRAGRDRKLLDFAKSIHVSKSAVSRAENGEPMSAVNFLALCAACGLSPWAYFRSGR